MDPLPLESQNLAGKVLNILLKDYCFTNPCIFQFTFIRVKKMKSRLKEDIHPNINVILN